MPVLETRGEDEWDKCYAEGVSKSNPKTLMGCAKEVGDDAARWVLAQSPSRSRITWPDAAD